MDQEANARDAKSRSSSPDRPLAAGGVLWRDGRVSGPIALPADAERFIECFNATYAPVGLRIVARIVARFSESSSSA